MTLAMIPDERAVLGEYVRDTADKIGLRDWHFNIAHEPCEEDYGAQVHTTYGQKVARISFAHEFRQLTPEDQRETVLHELMHVPMFPFRLYIERTLPDLIGEPASNAVIATFLQRNEEATDQFAKVFAPFFPLIEWPAVPLTVVK